MLLSASVNKTYIYLMFTVLLFLKGGGDASGAA